MQERYEDLQFVADDLLATLRVIRDHIAAVVDLPTPEWTEEQKLSLSIAYDMAELTADDSTVEDHIRGARLWKQLEQMNEAEEVRE